MKAVYKCFLLLAGLSLIFCLSIPGCGKEDDEKRMPEDDSSPGDSDDDFGDDNWDSEDEWEDVGTGLMWQVEPGCCKSRQKASAYCEGLTFSGYDDWRLPTISELRTLVTGCVATDSEGTCNVSDECTDDSCADDSCSGCEGLDGPGNGGHYLPKGLTGGNYHTWSSTSVTGKEDIDKFGWSLSTTYAEISFSETEIENYIGMRCVRNLGASR